MAALVPDELWIEIEHLLPKHEPSPKGGRPPVGDREALTGIVFVLKTGIPWQMLPNELGCGSGSTCWRRLQEWTAAGVWQEVHKRLLRILGKAGKVDLSRAVIDSASVRAVFGGRIRVPIPRIAAKRAVNVTC